jgi:3-oxoacyl-[acyl-carrier protein] reductase
MGHLDGKVALVTGAARGIGAAIARRLAADGATVVVNYVSDGESAARVVAACPGGLAVQADLSRPGACRALVQRAVAERGRVDILVNNAGVTAWRTLDQIDEEHERRLFDLNVRGVLYTSQAAAATMGEGGRIVNISSGASRALVAGGSVYAATKAAVEAMTRCHAAELGPRGITVNAVAPGFVETDLLRAVVPAEALPGIVGRTALRRLAQPEDIADAVAFLVGPDGRWITGQILNANGGLE